MTEAITFFSWGYWGWGNATPRLLEAVDAVEDTRGFAPPLFVDVRISRSVRAVGFRERAFEQLIGHDRYKWMRSLGNKRIETHTGPAIQIAEPSAANELLDLGLRMSPERRRLLFFCSCERPVSSLGESCHRVTVADLVRSVAAERGIAIETVEWPGGVPDAIEFHVARAMIRSVRKGRASLPLGEPLELGRVAGLAWGTCVTLRAPDDAVVIASGPAMFQGGNWCLPVLNRFTEQEVTESVPTRWAGQFREAHGYLPGHAASPGDPVEPSED